MSSSSTASSVVWLSVDPVRRKLDFYPRAIAARVEQAYQGRDPWSPSACALGSDFFNATVHFHPSGSCYQTTPGMSMGRAGFKQPGYRSVKRVLKTPNARVQVFSKQVHGEWRIASSELDSEMTFDEPMPVDCMVDVLAEQPITAPQFHAWTGADLSSGAWDVSVVVWQWCRGVPERHGNLLALSDEWWCPYMADANRKIEDSFSSQEPFAAITVNEQALKIRFTRDQSFALQVDEAHGKERAVRRMVRTIQVVKMMLDRLASPPIDPSEVVEMLPANSVPHHFFCPITQDIMHDPVKTIDGMTYDRAAIERWFLEHSTSPLTGLPLNAKTLVPHVTMREQITNFVKRHAHLKSDNSSMQLFAEEAALAGAAASSEPSTAAPGNS